MSFSNIVPSRTGATSCFRSSVFRDQKSPNAAIQARGFGGNVGGQLRRQLCVSVPC